MQFVTLPGTSLTLSRLGFGTSTLHHNFRRKDRVALLGAAIDAGITHFDTARMYGEGLAEKELGRFLKGLRNEVTVSTKFGLPSIPLLERVPPLMYAHKAFAGVSRRLVPSLYKRQRCLSLSCVKDSLRRSLNSLRTDWIDIFLLHEPQHSDIEQLRDVVEFLQLQKQAGSIRYLGFAGDAMRCLEVSNSIGDVFDVFQVQDSLEKKEADSILKAGKPLQITYGYLRSLFASKDFPLDPLKVISDARQRNTDGVILVSSRKTERLRELAQIFD